MNKLIGFFVFTAAAAAAIDSLADTVAWFHFDERDPGFAIGSSDPGTVTNVCNALTEVYAYATTGAGMGATPPQYMPRYTAPACQSRLYDPVSGREWRNRAAMRFTTGTESDKGGSYYGSTLKVPGTDKSFQPTDAITVECFVCTTGGVFDTFSPIFGKRNSGDYAHEPWALYMTANGKLEVRIKANASGTTGQGVAINDGRWHHVALTYDKADSVCRVYVDYKESFTFSPSAKGAISYLDSSNEGYTAFHIGGYPYVSGANVGRKFDGCIDELRISDVALDPSRFIRMTEPGDRDEMVRVSFDPHGFYGSVMRTDVNYNSRRDVEAKFTDMGGAVSLDADEKCAAAVSAGLFGEEVGNYGACSLARNADGKSGYVKVAALTTAMSGGNVETNIDYTIEAFFKTRTTDKAYGPRTLFTLGTWPVGGVVLNNKDQSGQVCFTYNDGEAWKGVYSTETTANDGCWHHVAVVHDSVRRQMRFYYDHKLSASVNGVDNVLQTGSSLFIGSNTSGANGFDGWIDEVRVMNRALLPEEFLTAHGISGADADDPAVALFDFEDGYASSLYPALVGEGEGLKHSAAGNVPVFAAHERTYLLDGTNGSEKASGKLCLELSDGQAVWPYSPVFEQEEFTVEFFANVASLVNGGSPLRYVGGTESLTADPVWALYRDPSTDKLCLRIQLVKNGVSAGNYTAKWDFSPEGPDRGWHHYAFTLAPKDGTNTVVEFFRDYVSAGSYELQGRLDYTLGKGGRLAIGAGADNNKVYAQYDMIRFSKRVVEPARFIGKLNSGMMITIR